MRTLVGTTALALALTMASQAFAYTAYVSNEKGNTVSVIDLDKMEVTATVPVGERPRGIIMSGDNKQVYICTSDADHIEVLDTETLKVTKTLRAVRTLSSSPSLRRQGRSTSPTKTTTW
jgi:YVTN family beta-propeller protein